MRDRLHLLALQVYRRLPVQGRRAIVRRVAPGFTVGSLVVVRDGERVLLVRHAYRQRWGLPGGLMARRETPALAAVRETKEEVGLDIRLTGPSTCVVDVVARRIDFAFEAVAERPDAAYAVSVELLEARWFDRDALPEVQAEVQSTFDALARWQQGPLVLPADEPSGWLT